MEIKTLILILALIDLLLFFLPSKFEQIYQCNYETPSRIFPSGHIPGNYLVPGNITRRFVTPEGEQELLEKYVNLFDN